MLDVGSLEAEDFAVLVVLVQRDGSGASVQGGRGDLQGVEARQVYFFVRSDHLGDGVAGGFQDAFLQVGLFAVALEEVGRWNERVRWGGCEAVRLTEFGAVGQSGQD